MLLERMRQGTAKVVGSILAVLLIVAMAAWGIDDLLQPQAGTQSLAQVGDSEITSREFDREFRNALNRLRQTLGSDLDVQRARQFGIAQGTLEGLVDRRLLSIAARGLGIVVGEDVITAQIRGDQLFRDVGGRFDFATFQQVLAQSNLSEGQYVALLRDQLMRGYVTDAVAAGTAVPPDLARGLYRYREQKRSADIVTVKRSVFSKVGTPTEPQLVEHHKKNAAAFTAPEYRKTKVILLRPADFAAGLSPSEEEIQAEYENRVDSIKIPERRKLQQILFSDEATAKKAGGLLKEGRNYATVAKEVAGSKASELALGFMTKNELAAVSGALADAAFAVKKGQTTVPVGTPLGWHIIRVEAIRPGRTPTLGDMRAQISKEIALDKATEQLTDVANKVEDALAGGASMEEAASQVGVALVDPPPIDRGGLAADGKKPAKLPTAPVFLQTAFTTNEGETSQMQETPEGGFLIARVDRVIPPALKPLDKVRKAVADAWRQARQDEAAAKRAREILEKVKGGDSLAKAAKAFKLTASPGPLVTRRGDEQGKFPRPLLENLFALKVGAAAMGPTADGYAVIRLNKVEDPKTSAGKDTPEEFRNGILRSVSADLMQQFSQALRVRYPVSMDQQALDSYLDRYAGNDGYAGSGG